MKTFSWIIKQSKGCNVQLSVLVFSQIGLIVVNLVMAFILSQFTEYAAGARDYSLMQLIGVAFGMFLVEGIVCVVEAVCKKDVYLRMEQKIRLETVTKIQCSSLWELQKYHEAEILSRLTKDVELIANCLQNLITNLLGKCMMAAAAVVYLFILNWKLAMIILAAIPLIGLMTGIFTPMHGKYSRIDKENEDQNRVQMQESISNIVLIKVYRAQKYIISKINNAYQAKRKSGLRLGVMEGIFSFANNMAGSVLFLLIMIFGAYFTARGEFSVGGMVAVLNLLNYIVWPFSNIGAAVSEWNQANVSVQRLCELQHLPSIEVKNDTETCDEKFALTVHNLSFSYHKGQPVLKNINVNFQPNGVVGIIGKSGGGKSTLMKLLLGIYKPQSGAISMNGHQKVAYVPSGSALFLGTVSENIALSDTFDIKWVMECAKMANADGFIHEMPNGYDEQIGGTNHCLSSGQAQRIAIARAYYTNANIIIFDEPTSNLDAGSMEHFHRTVREICKDKLCIIVTHNQETIQICDTVFQLEQGELIYCY